MRSTFRGFGGGMISQSKDLITDINHIQWPSGASVLYTNQLTAGGLLKDLSGNGNHGTMSGPTARNGPWGKCWYCDTTDDDISIGEALRVVYNPVTVALLVN